VSSAMLSEIHKVFSVALKHATLTGIIKHNPISLVKKPKPIKKEMFVWNKEEAKRFLDSIKKERLYPLFHLALSSGMRKSEMLGLRWKDINFSNQTIQVVQTLSNDGKTIFSTTKTKSGKRSISIDENTLNILKVHRNVINSEKELQSDYDDRDLVFATSSGKPTVSSNVTRSFNAYIKSSRSKKIKFHDLRHSFATILLTEGIHPKIVAEMLGHADMRTTLEIYSHVNQNMQRDVADKVGKFFL
jgi:integrase